MFVSDEWVKCGFTTDSVNCRFAVDIATGQLLGNVSFKKIFHEYKHLSVYPQCLHWDTSLYVDGYDAAGSSMGRVAYYMTIVNDISHPIYTLATSWKITPPQVLFSLFARDMNIALDGLHLTDFNNADVLTFLRMCLMQGDMMEMPALVGSVAPRGNIGDRRKNHNVKMVYLYRMVSIVVYVLGCDLG